MAQLTGEVAVVTGGAGQNIGSSVASKLAEDGASVGIIDIDATNGENTVSKIESNGGDAIFAKADLTDVESTKKAIDEIASEFGGIDIMVASAGMAFGTSLDSIDEEDFYKNIDTNLKSTFFSTKAALPYLRDEGGSVVFVSSVNALLGGFSEVAYASAKGGLHSLSRGLTADYGDEGVRFNVVAAGSILGDSDIWEEREEDQPGLLDQIDDLYPLGRSGEPEDVANTVSFLASAEASWISGVVLPVDGGLTATGAISGGRWWENL